MNPTDEDEILAGLDWDVKTACVIRDCFYVATSLVQAQPGPESCLHETWLPVCSGHEKTLRNGDHHCRSCKETLIVHIIRTI